MYRVEIESGAQRSLRKFSLEIQKRLIETAAKLADNPRPPGCLKLEVKLNAWRIRCGDYRIIYEIYDESLLVRIIRIDHRSIVYR